MADLPTTAPWTRPFRQIDPAKIVLIRNSSVTWTQSFLNDYADYYDIPRSNIFSFAFGANADTDPLTYQPVDLATFNTDLLQPLRTFCRNLKAQAILMGPAVPLICKAADVTSTLQDGIMATLLGAAINYPPSLRRTTDPTEVSTYSVYTSQSAGNVRFTTDVATYGIPRTKAIDVTSIANNIRTSGLFASGNRMNFWAVMQTLGGRVDIARAVNSAFGISPRLTIVQGGVTVYDFSLASTADDGYETIGVGWATGTTFETICGDANSDGSGTSAGDWVAGWSFPSVTLNPAIAIDSATLTLGYSSGLHSQDWIFNGTYADYGTVTMRIFGESQAAATSAQWTTFNRPIAKPATAVASTVDASFTFEPSAPWLTTSGGIGTDAELFTYEFGYDSVDDTNFTEKYEFPEVSLAVNDIYILTQGSTAYLGSDAFYNTTESAAIAIPYLPVGRIGIASWGGGAGYPTNQPPVVETEEVVRSIFTATKSAWAQHDIDTARTKEILINLSNQDGGINSASAWATLISRMKSWGLNVRYGYYHTPTALQESLAPLAQATYTRATAEAGLVRENFYLMAGEWDNPTYVGNDAYYLGYRSNSWIPTVGAGCMMGPSYAWQAGMWALSRGASCVYSDDTHITIYNEAAQWSVFYALLRGMSWLEAHAFANTDYGNIPCGDPLWAPFRIESRRAGGDVINGKLRATTRHQPLPRKSFRR